MHMCIYVHACTHTERERDTHTCMHARVCVCADTYGAFVHSGDLDPHYPAMIYTYYIVYIFFFLCTAETLIPIIRQSVPDPFPEDMEAEKKDELTRYTTQAIEAIETLQVV